jgi:uncharacterized integral membrane protein
VAHRDPAERLSTTKELHMLWTILIVLAIIALIIFILGAVRGRRGI